MSPERKPSDDGSQEDVDSFKNDVSNPVGKPSLVNGDERGISGSHNSSINWIGDSDEQATDASNESRGEKENET